jgi:TolB protein
VALVLLMVVALLTISRRDYSGAWIAYATIEERDPVIYLMTGDGASVRRAAHRPICGTTPRWSPDGEWIAFVSDCFGTDNVFRMRANGTGLVNLTTAPSYAGGPQWSPDGSRLLMVYGASLLMFIDPENANQARFMSNYLWPQWSPDGAWVYALPLMDTGSSLHRINVETRQAERILPARTDPTALSWSPDGEWITVGVLTATGYELHIMRPDGSQRTPVTDDFPPSHIRAPQWSPDGQWIAFFGGQPFDWHLYRIRPDGRDLQRLSHTSGDMRDLQFSPDGRWLLFAADDGRGFDLFRMHPDGSSLQNLTLGVGGFSPQYAPERPPVRAWFAALMIVGALLIGKRK